MILYNVFHFSLSTFKNKITFTRQLNLIPFFLNIAQQPYSYLTYNFFQNMSGNKISSIHVFLMYFSGTFLNSCLGFGRISVLKLLQIIANLSTRNTENIFQPTRTIFGYVSCHYGSFLGWNAVLDRVPAMNAPITQDREL